MLNLKIKNYITENEEEKSLEIIFNAIDHKQKILINSPMKTGKTTFMIESLSDKLIQCDIQPVIIVPVLSLMDNIKSKYNFIDKSNGLTKEITLNNKPVVSTPESLHKVISTCEKENKHFYLIYDEIHQAILNSNFRKQLINPLVCYDNELCIGLMGLSATIEPLEPINFDIVYKIDVENKFIQSDETIITTDFIKNCDNILSFIKHIKATNKHKLVIARINNKEHIKAINSKLNNCLTWYRTENQLEEDKNYIKSMEMLESALNGYDISDNKNINYILCTSLIDVGVELQFKEKPIVIDFIDNTSNLIDDIQFIGRFRQGVDKLYLVGGLDVEEPYTKPKSYIKEYQKKLEINKKIVESMNITNNLIKQTGEKIKTPLETTSISYNYATEEYELNEYILMSEVFKECISFYKQRGVYLKRLLEKHHTFNSKVINITSYNSLNIDESTEIKEEQKAIKKDVENKEKDFFEKIKALNIEDDKLKMILNIDDVDNKDLWKIKNYDDIYNRWKHEELEEYRKRYDKSYDMLKNTKVKQIKMLEIALKQKQVSDLRKQINIINYNLLFNENKELKANGKDMLIVYKIREYINKAKGKERDVYLSNKFKLELLEQLKKEKSLSKLTPISLDKHLKLIYNISVNKQKRNIITSIKTNI